MSSLINDIKANHKEKHQKMEDDKKAKKHPGDEISRSEKPKEKQHKLREFITAARLNKGLSTHL